MTFASLDRSLQRRILQKLRCFETSQNPLHFAKKLQGTNFYRFRIGDYLLIIVPKEKQTMIILLILKIGHRREIYNDLQ